MQLTNMELRSRFETAQLSDGLPGRTEHRATLTMEWVGSPEEFERLREHLNGGAPTTRFWEALEFGEVPSTGSSVVVQVGQLGNIGSEVAVVVPLGTFACAQVPVAGLDMDGRPVGSDIALKIGVRSC